MSKLFRFTYEGVIKAEDKGDAYNKFLSENSQVREGFQRDLAYTFRKSDLEELKSEDQLNDKEWLDGIPLGDDEKVTVVEYLDNKTNTEDLISELKELINKYEE